MGGVSKEFWNLQNAIEYNIVFEQDGVLMHKEKSATFWFQVPNTPLIFYPLNSPGLNSIKPLSKILK